jgi:hypothetical protein
VDQERTSRLEPNNQILAAATDGRDALALELVRDLDRVEWARQARVGDRHTLEDPALEHGCEPPADRLDLGELRHAPTVARGS